MFDENIPRKEAVQIQRKKKKLEKDYIPYSKKAMTASHFLKEHFDGYGWCCSCLLLISFSAA